MIRPLCLVAALLLAPLPASAAGAACKGATGELQTRCWLAAELNEVTGTAELMRDAMRQTMAVTTQRLAPGNEARADEIGRVVSEEFITAFEPMIPAFLDFNRDLLAGAFSAEELREMIRFYKSDVGRKMVETQPRLQAEGMIFGQKMGAVAVQQALPRIIDRLRAANLAVPNRL